MNTPIVLLLLQNDDGTYSVADNPNPEALECANFATRAAAQSVVSAALLGFIVPFFDALTASHPKEVTP